MATIKGSRLARYTPGNPPASPAELPRWMREELERLADSMQSPAPMVSLDVSYKATDRLPSDRVPIVYADGTRWNPGSGAGVYAYYSGAWRLLGASSALNIQSVTSSSTVTPTFSNDMVKITAQATGLTLANPTGTATEGWGLVIRVKDNGTARTISYGTQYRAVGITLPTTTVAGKTMYLACMWNDTDTKLDVVAVGQEA